MQFPCTHLNLLYVTLFHRQGLLDRLPNVKYIREAYGLNECGHVTLTYPKEKKNSVAASKVS